VTDLDTIRRETGDLGITIVELATESGLSPSHVGKQLRGDLPLRGRVRRALVELLDRRALAIMPHIVRRLREHGEDQAAEACERVGGRLTEQVAGSPPIAPDDA